MSSEIEKDIGRRLYELVGQGDQLLEQYPSDHGIYLKGRAEAVAWLLSAVNILEVALPSDNRHRVQAVRLLPAPSDVIFPDRLAAILGILKSAAAEWTSGMIKTLEFHFLGIAFEDFLRHAAAHNEAGRKIEAAVLASAVLEDAIGRLCRKH